jgi:purine-binding chemotaxis protein CheW
MAEASAGRVLVCRIGSERVALPVSAVRQVVASSSVTRIPGSAPAVRGLTNVQGTLVTAINGPSLLGQRTKDRSDWLVVLSLFGGRVGLEVDDVEDVHDRTPETPRMLELERLLRPLLTES